MDKRPTEAEWLDADKAWSSHLAHLFDAIQVLQSSDKAEAAMAIHTLHHLLAILNMYLSDSAGVKGRQHAMGTLLRALEHEQVAACKAKLSQSIQDARQKRTDLEKELSEAEAKLPKKSVKAKTVTHIGGAVKARTERRTTRTKSGPAASNTANNWFGLGSRRGRTEAGTRL